jgi:hypothetical protein
MEDIIREMIQKALSYKANRKIDEAYELVAFTKDLIDRFADTINCPSNWRDIGDEIASEYYENNWVYDNLELWNYRE